MNTLDDAIRRSMAFLRSGRQPTAADRRDLETVHRAIARQIFSVVRNVRGTDPEDIAQDVLLKVWSKLLENPDWESSVKRPAAMFKTIACRTALDRVRASDHAKRFAGERSAEEWLDATMAEQSNDEGWKGIEHNGAIECAREAYALIVSSKAHRDNGADWMSYVLEHVTPAELAEKNNIAQNTQRQRLFAFGKRIRDVMRRICPDEWREFTETSAL